MVFKLSQSNLALWPADQEFRSMGWMSCLLVLCKRSKRGELAGMYGPSSAACVEGGGFSRQCCLEVCSLLIFFPAME